MDFDGLSEALRGLLEVLPDDSSMVDVSGLTAQRRKRLRTLIQQAVTRLEAVSTGLDPVRLPQIVFDPSDPDVVGRLIGDTLLEQPRSPLGSLARFYGSGVYALYYLGDFPAYAPIRCSDTPIYVGKADPAAQDARTPIEQGEKLYSRLVAEHGKSIKQVEEYARSANLTRFIKLADFECRYLVVRSA